MFTLYQLFLRTRHLLEAAAAIVGAVPPWVISWMNPKCRQHLAELLGSLVVKRDTLQLGTRRVVVDERWYLTAHYVHAELARVVALGPLVLEPG